MYLVHLEDKRLECEVVSLVRWEPKRGWERVEQGTGGEKWSLTF